MHNPLVAPKPIDSARVCVRPLTESDLPALLAINSDKAVTRFLGHASWQVMADAEAWFKRISALQASGSALEFVIEAKQTNSVIGRCALFDYDAANACISLGYTLGRAHWRQGYMREALTALLDCTFRDMNLRRLEAQVEEHNTASANLLRHLGFIREGVLRERWINKGNTTINSEVFGLLRHEWPQPDQASPSTEFDAALRHRTITMKRTTPTDIPKLVMMMDEFYAEGGYHLNHHRATEAFTTLVADERLGFAWFIQADGQNVGYVVVTLSYSMEYGGRNAIVDDLFVRVPYRHAGFASAALTDVRAFCTQLGVRAMHVETGKDNTAADAVYRRFGFTPTDRQLLALRLANPTHYE